MNNDITIFDDAMDGGGTSPRMGEVDRAGSERSRSSGNDQAGVG